jgi:hypothetical protein
VSTLDLFKERAKDLPLRPTGVRSDMIHSLDTLWNMKFTHLSRNARDFLGVISLLSPGRFPSLKLGNIVPVRTDII